MGHESADYQAGFSPWLAKYVPEVTKLLERQCLHHARLLLGRIHATSRPFHFPLCSVLADTVVDGMTSFFLVFGPRLYHVNISLEALKHARIGIRFPNHRALDRAPLKLLALAVSLARAIDSATKHLVH